MSDFSLPVDLTIIDFAPLSTVTLDNGILEIVGLLEKYDNSTGLPFVWRSVTDLSGKHCGRTCVLLI